MAFVFLIFLSGAYAAFGLITNRALTHLAASDPLYADTATLTAEGYWSVANLKNADEMRRFIVRTIEGQGWQLKEQSEGQLSGFVPYYSGRASTQSFEALVEELGRVPWVDHGVSVASASNADISEQSNAIPSLVEARLVEEVNNANATASTNLTGASSAMNTEQTPPQQEPQVNAISSDSQVVADVTTIAEAQSAAEGNTNVDATASENVSDASNAIISEQTPPQQELLDSASSSDASVKVTDANNAIIAEQTPLQEEPLDNASPSDSTAVANIPALVEAQTFAEGNTNANASESSNVIAPGSAIVNTTANASADSALPTTVHDNRNPFQALKTFLGGLVKAQSASDGDNNANATATANVTNASNTNMSEQSQLEEELDVSAGSMGSTATANSSTLTAAEMSTEANANASASSSANVTDAGNAIIADQAPLGEELQDDAISSDSPVVDDGTALTDAPSAAEVNTNVDATASANVTDASSAIISEQTPPQQELQDRGSSSDLTDAKNPIIEEQTPLQEKLLNNVSLSDSTAVANIPALLEAPMSAEGNRNVNASEASNVTAAGSAIATATANASQDAGMPTTVHDNWNPLQALKTFLGGLVKAQSISEGDNNANAIASANSTDASNTNMSEQSPMEEELGVSPASSDPLYADTATMTADGYWSVAKLKNDDEMRRFIVRAIEGQGWQLKEQSLGQLSGFVPYYSGRASTQSFRALVEELGKASWVDHGVSVASASNPTAAEQSNAIPSLVDATLVGEATTNTNATASTNMTGASGAMNSEQTPPQQELQVIAISDSPVAVDVTTPTEAQSAAEGNTNADGTASANGTDADEVIISEHTAPQQELQGNASFLDSPAGVNAEALVEAQTLEAANTNANATEGTNMTAGGSATVSATANATVDVDSPTFHDIGNPFQAFKAFLGALPRV